MSRRGISLEEISKDYPTILVDTCVLIGQINGKGYDMVRNSAHFFKKHIDEGVMIHVTPSTFREYSDGGPLFDRKNLLDTLQDNDGIFQLSEGEKLWYDVLSKGYSKLRDKFKIEETDYNFLLSGVVIFQSRKAPTALISNDMGILRAWKFLLMKERLSPEELGFLIRIGDETFKKVNPPKNYKKI